MLKIGSSRFRPTHTAPVVPLVLELYGLTARPVAGQLCPGRHWDPLFPFPALPIAGMQTDMIATLTTKPNIVIARSPRRIRKPNPALKLKLARADGRMTALGGVWEGWRSPQGRDRPYVRHHHGSRRPGHRWPARPHAASPGGAGLGGLALRNQGQFLRAAPTVAARIDCTVGTQFTVRREPENLNTRLFTQLPC